ncbi:hypothetical protein ICE98_01135 [Lactococcus lactis]|nr:hypothetical protein [Lactococcus lactis]
MGTDEQKLVAYSAKGLYQHLLPEEIDEIEDYLKGSNFGDFSSFQSFLILEISSMKI